MKRPGQGAQEAVPRVGRRAEAERLPLLRRDAAALEDRPRRRVPRELLAEESRGGQERLGGARLLRPVGAGAGAAERERDPRATGEVGDRLRELELLGLADEGDRVPLRPAAEAVVEALVRVDVERRRLLAVERAEPLPGVPRLLQRR